ncbi:voltage-gated chloride channel family protein [Pedobacter sp.]|uniref:voltage-gated chloride channel family protein n=1 Tax=Pedobacter sp. TaxID=1411316 RepID=UPI003D7F6A6F
MNNRYQNLKVQYPFIYTLLRWAIIMIPVAIGIGSIIALFLTLLNAAIQYRFQHPWLLYFLPLAGLLIYLIYRYYGQPAEKGNHLIIEQIQLEGAAVPKRMAPIILLTTVITHLFGGSAGREGTAVQIGGSIASLFGRWLKLTGIDRRMVLTAGVAAGFGAVFGTPFAGAIFAIEFLTSRKIKIDTFLPALFAAVIGDLTVSFWQVAHVHYRIDTVVTAPTFIATYFTFDFLLLFKVMLASIAFGLASFLFARMVLEIKLLFNRLFALKWLIPIFGGLLIIALTVLIGKPDYLSLGVAAEYPGAVTISSAFKQGGADSWSWLWKTIYTAVTLGTGFKGGEVTPLFYIGATLGNTLAILLNAPVSLFAALGFIAVFAGATNTPLACTTMGVELFGPQYIVLFALACFTAYLFSGYTGIYNTRRMPARLFAGTLKSNTYLQRKFTKYLQPFKKTKRL